MAKKEEGLDTLELTLKSARDAQDNGWPPEIINRDIILAAGYKSMKDFERAVINRASIKVRKNVPTSEKGVLQGYAREVANGLTMGLWGQGESLINSIISGTPWDYEKDLMRTERAEYQDANPVHSTIGNLAGAMATGAGLTKAAFSKLPALAPKAGAPISSFAKEAGVESVLGATEGGITALAEGGDVGSSTGLGSAMGVVGTGASRLIDPISRGIKHGTQRLSDFFDPTVSKSPKAIAQPEPTLPEKRALDKLEESFTDDGMTPQAREAKIGEFEEAGLADEVSPRFLGGENTNQLAKDAVIEKGPQKQQVKKNLLETMESDRGRVQQFMDDGLGYNKEGSPQVVDELMEKRTRDAAPHYDEAFTSKNIESDVIDDVMVHKRFRDAYREAQETNRLDPNKLMDMPDLPEGRNSPIGGWSIYALDQVKKIIDLQRKLPPSAQNAPNKKLAKHLGEQTEIMLGAIDDVVPSYGTARKIWSGSMEETEAYELGMKAYTGKKVSVVRSEFKKLKTEAEREMYRLGASTEAIGKMDQTVSPTKSHSKVFSSTDNLKKHEILFGDPEATAKFTNQLGLLDSMHRASSDQMPRSDSGANIIRFIRQGLDVATTTSGASGFLRKITDVASDPLRLAQQRATNKAVGDKMSVTGVEGTRQVEKQLANRQKQLSDNILKRGVASGGITAAGAHLLGSSDGEVSKKKGSLLSTSY